MQESTWLKIAVPEAYVNPFPLEWSEQENAQAITFGVELVLHHKRLHENTGLEKDMLEAVHRVIGEKNKAEMNTMRDDIARLTQELGCKQCELVATREQLRSAGEESRMRHEASAANTAQQHQLELSEVERRVREETCDEVTRLKEKLANMQCDLGTTREQLRSAEEESCMRHEASTAKAAREHQLELSEVERRVREEMHASVERANQRADEARSSMEALLNEQRKCNEQAAQQHERDVALRKSQYEHDKRVLLALHQQAEHRAEQAEHRAEESQRELKTAQQELSDMRVPSMRGNELEQKLLDAVHADGLYGVDVSKGSHNGHYMDLLVAPYQPLLQHIRPDGAGPQVPTYLTPGNAPQLRCSTEWKGHRSSSGITQEVKKFAEVRTKMVKERRAECFCFAATAHIPGKPRRSIELLQIGDRWCATAYVGAPDISMAEVTFLVSVVLEMQARINAELAPDRQPQHAVVRDLVDVGKRVLLTLQANINHCDNMEKSAQSQLELVKAMRESNVELALSQLLALKTNNLAESTESNRILDQALSSVLEGDKRNTTCPILRTKEQYTKAKESVKATLSVTSEPSSDGVAAVSGVKQKGVKRARV